MAVSPADLLGNGVSVVDGQVTRTVDVTHGLLALAPDGAFTYRPERDYVGPDSFWYVLTVRGETSAAVEVSIEVERVAASADPMGGLAIGSVGRGGGNAPDVTFGSLGPLSFSFEWLIPSLVVSVPGLLLLIAIAAQMLAGAAWLPFVRRNLGDFGFTRRNRQDGSRA